MSLVIKARIVVYKDYKIFIPANCQLFRLPVSEKVLVLLRG